MTVMGIERMTAKPPAFGWTLTILDYFYRRRLDVLHLVDFFFRRMIYKNNHKPSR
jgi:hypothetical protein